MLIRDPRGGTLPLIRLMKGSRRYVLLLGRWAIKVPHSRLGMHCNRNEAIIWRRAFPTNRVKLCPVVFSLPLGVVIVMPRASPVTLDERNAYDSDSTDPGKIDVFLWDPEPSGNYALLEPKPENLGWLNGLMVHVDYGEPVDWGECRATPAR
jgi:hypothetical protein